MPGSLIADVGTHSLNLPLRHDTLRLGSDSHCELRIDHEEVESHALTLDYRGDALLLQNNNPYEVYLGDRTLPTGAWSPWPPHTALRLTRSVTLTYESDVQPANVPNGTGEVIEAPNGVGLSTRQMVQLGVICLCAIIGLLVWNTEPSTAPEAYDTFNDIQSKVAKQIEIEKGARRASQGLSELQRLLQEARLAEMRWKVRDPERSINAYQRLLNRNEIRDAKEQGTKPLDGLYWNIHQYASQKKAVLGQ